MSGNTEEKKEGYWESIEKAAQRVNAWPELKKNSSGFKSNYVSELHPRLGEACSKNEEKGSKK